MGYDYRTLRTGVCILGLMAALVSGCYHPPMVPGPPGVSGVPVTPNVQPRRVHVTTTPSGVDVAVDGQGEGQSPWQGELDIGLHSLVVGGAQGYRTVERRVRVRFRHRYIREHVYLPRTGALDYRFFNYQLVFQAQGLTLGEYIGYGGGFQGIMRFLFTVAKPRVGSGEMLIDLGFELGGGFFYDQVFEADDPEHWDVSRAEFIGYDNVRYRLRSDTNQIYNSNAFQASLYFGLMIPLVVSDRPLLYLTLNTSQGTSAAGNYQFHVAAGLSVFPSDLMELRFELASFRTHIYSDILAECVRTISGECEWENVDGSVVFAHYTPAFVLSFRFH